MRELSSSNFGLLIAFVLPGFTALWGVTYLSPVIGLWLKGAETTGPTVGGFLYVTLASVAVGLTVSTVRWATLDWIHHVTGLQRPQWDFSQLQDHIAAYKTLHEIHYKFYQFNSNTFVALVFVYITRRIHLGFFELSFDFYDFGFLLLFVVLFAGSRDTLRNYYSRVNHLLASDS